MIDLPKHTFPSVCFSKLLLHKSAFLIHLCSLQENTPSWVFLTPLSVSTSGNYSFRWFLQQNTIKENWFPKNPEFPLQKIALMSLNNNSANSLVNDFLKINRKASSCSRWQQIQRPSERQYTWRKSFIFAIPILTYWTAGLSTNCL